MGKLLIIKGADFSEVAVDKVTPIWNGPIITITSVGSVTIADDSATAIYYTTDGTTPTTSSTKYSSAFTVEVGTTVKAISVYANGSISDVVSKTYMAIDGDLYFPLTSNREEYSSLVTADNEQLVSYSESKGATFSGDNTIKAGIRYNLSELSNQISTIYCEFMNDGSVSSYQQYAVSLYAASTSGSFRLSIGVLGTSLQASVNQVVDGTLTVPYNLGILNKVAIRIGDGSFSVFLNGSKVYSKDFSNTLPEGLYLTIGNSWKLGSSASDSRTFQGSVKNVRCYYDALTDDKLITLTE